MFALDLFNTDHERRLAEGAVDQLEQRRIDDLAMKMDDLVARARKADTPEARAALVKEFQKCKAERDSYYMIRNETMGYGTLAGEGQVTPTATGIRHHAKPGVYGGFEKEKDPLAKLDKGTTNSLEKAMGIKFDRQKKYQGGLDVDEAGIPGNVPTEKIPGKEDLLKGKGRSYYEAQTQKKNPKEVNEHGGGIGPRQHWQDLMQETKLAVGDPVVVTAPNEFEGKTGEIYDFSPSGTFVVVDLYNHGKHSMHLSDIEYNQYADDQEQDDWYDDIDDGPQHAYNSDERTRSDQFEGFQDFNKVEPYAVCLAGKPVKKFDYYEQARRFHDNWKQKLYRKGNKEKADKITLMPLNLDESVGKQLSVEQLATISDAALDSAYGYGRSQPGNTFGWQANLKSAAFAKQMIDRGVTDIEAISDAIHKGWNVTAQAFVKNPQMFDDSKTMAPEKLQAKIAQRQKLMTQNYAQLPEDEKEKDRVVARAMLQAITGQQGVAEAVPTIRGTPKTQPSANYTGEDLVRDANALFTAGGFKLVDKEVEPRVDDPKKINTTYYWRKKIKGLTPDQGQVQQLMIEIYNYAPKRTYWAINDWANDGAQVTPDLAQKLWRRMEKTIKDSIDTAEQENYWYSMIGNGKVPKDLEEAADPAQQAAIAIAMKKAGKKPKQMDEFALLPMTAMNAIQKAVTPEPPEWVQPISAMREAEGSWIVYDPETKQIKKRFKTHTAGKSYAKTHSLGFASSEYYFDNIKQAVNELDINTLKSYADKRGAQVAAMKADNPNPQTGSKEWIKQAVPAQKVARAGQKIARKERQASVGEAIVASGPSQPLDDRAIRKMVWDTMKINADTGEQALQRALTVLAKKPQSRMVQDLQDKFQNLADRLAQGVLEGQTDYQKRRQRERDIDAGKPIPKQREPRMTDYQKKRAQDKRDMTLGEDQDTAGVERAILNRIMTAHTDLLMKFGPEKVMQAAEEVAYNVGDVDEIGTSDVSAYVAQVKQILGVPAELDEKWSQKYKSSINCANPKGFSQRAHCAGRKK